MTPKRGQKSINATSGWSQPQTLVRGPESEELWQKAKPIWTSKGTPVTAQEPGPARNPHGTLTISLPLHKRPLPGMLHVLFQSAPDGNDGLAFGLDATTHQIAFERKTNGHFTSLKRASLPVSVFATPSLSMTISCQNEVATARANGKIALQQKIPGDAGGCWGFQADQKDVVLSSFQLRDAQGHVIAHADPDHSTQLPWFMHLRDGILRIPAGSCGMLGEPPAGDYWALLRKVVTLPAGDISSAFLFATAANPLGARQYVYRLLVNGQQAGTGPSRSATGPLYETHDITSLVHAGRNLLAALCWTQAGGWFRALLAVTYKDGRRILLGTDGSWRGRSGGKWRSWNGDINNTVHYYVAPREDIDARQEPVGWDTSPAWDQAEALGKGFRPVHVVDHSLPAPHADPSDHLSCLFRPPASIRRISPTRWLVNAGIESAYGVDLAIGGNSPAPRFPKGLPRLAGARLRLRMGEQMENAQSGTVRYLTLSCMRFEDEWTLRNGPQHLWHWGYRGFRWLQIDLLGTVSRQMAETIDRALNTGLKLRTDVVPEPEETASFTCSNEDLNEVWNFCATGIREGRQDLFMDTPVRERMPYEGDALTHGRCEMAFSRSYGLVRKTWRYLVRRPGKFTEYRFMMAPLAWEEYLETGDSDALRADWKLLWDEQAFRSVGKSGLVTKDPQSPGCTDIVDWPQPGELDGFVFTRTNTVVNEWALQGFDHCALIAHALGLKKEEEEARSAATRLRRVLQENVVTASGAWRDGLTTTHVALHSTLYALSLDAATRDQMKAGGRWLVSRCLPAGLPISPNAATWLLQALFASGQAQTGIDVMASHSPTSWWSMMHRWDATQPMEGWSPNTKWNTTFAHPWAAGPLWIINRQVLGVRVTQPGAACVDICPHIGSLRRVDGVVPTIRGRIHLHFTPHVAQITLPANMTAHLLLDGQERTLFPGTTIINRRMKNIEKTGKEGRTICKENNGNTRENPSGNKEN